VLLALLALLGLALVIVAVVVLTAPAPTKVTLRNVVYQDVGKASAALQQLVSENTKSRLQRAGARGCAMLVGHRRCSHS
jgi:hypothetical protein